MRIILHKIFFEKGIDQNQKDKVYVFPNCKRTYIALNLDSNTSKTAISAQSHQLYIKKSPLIKDDFEFKYDSTNYGNFIHTKQNTRDKIGWRSPIEIFYSTEPIKSQMYKLSQINEQVIKISSLLQPYPIQYQQYIPKQIIQIGSYNDQKRAKIQTTLWKEYNPDYKYIYLSNEDCFEYMRTRYGVKITNKWNKIGCVNTKREVFKICIITEEGGVYADLSTYPCVPLKETIQQNTLLLTTKKDNSERRLLNCFLQ